MGLKVSNLIDCGLCVSFKDGGCCSESREIRDAYEDNGRQFALKCPEFMNSRAPLKGELKLEDALKFMLAGNSEFIMVSGRTGTQLRYRLEQKVYTGNGEDQQFIYWLNTTDKSGTMVYAGVLYFDSNDWQFKFGKGSRGNLTSKDIRVESLLFVLNKLYNKKYNLNLKILHVGKCGKCGKKIETPYNIQIGLCNNCLNKCDIPSQLDKDLVKHLEEAEKEMLAEEQTERQPEIKEETMDEEYYPWSDGSPY